MALLLEIEKAKRELELARQDFEWAAAGYVEAATKRVHAAETRLNALLAEVKGHDHPVTWADIEKRLVTV